MELIKPEELNNDELDWTGRVRNSDIWETLNAAREGNINRLGKLIDRNHELVTCQYWYASPLHFAVREGHLEAAKLLVDRGADLTEQTLYGQETFLQVATDRGHTELVEYLQGLARERLGSEGDTHPIHTACKDGDLTSVVQLLDVDPTLVNRGDDFGRRPIHHAVESKSHELIEILVARGAEIDTPGFSSDSRIGGSGFRPIANAFWRHNVWAQRNDYETAQLLLKHGANYSMTIAAALGDEARVRELLASEPTLCDHQEPGGKRALSAAAERNYVDIVNVLLEAGANPNLEEGENCPQGYALWAASHFGYFEIAEALLAAGADPNAMVESSGNPTESAFNREMRELLYRHGGKVGFAQFFHENNVDVIAAALQNAPERFQTSLAVEGFTHSVSNGYATLVHMMLNAGIRVPPVLTYCQSYLWWNLELCELLLQHDMDPNLPNWQSIRPLHHMAQKNNVDGAKLMVKYGANPSLIDEEYRTTPLGWAAKSGSLDYVQYLLEQFPDRNVHEPPDIPDWSRPVEWAKRRGHQEIVEILS